MDKPTGNQHGKMWFLVLLTDLLPLHYLLFLSMKKRLSLLVPRNPHKPVFIECLLLVYSGNISWIIP